MASNFFINFILYPSSLPDDWEEYLADLGFPVFISPLHDNSFRKPHYHVFMIFPINCIYLDLSSLELYLNTHVRYIDFSNLAIYLGYLLDSKEISDNTSNNKYITIYNLD